MNNVSGVNIERISHVGLGEVLGNNSKVSSVALAALSFFKSIIDAVRSKISGDRFRFFQKMDIRVRSVNPEVSIEGKEVVSESPSEKKAPKLARFKEAAQKVIALNQERQKKIAENAQKLIPSVKLLNNNFLVNDFNMGVEWLKKNLSELSEFQNSMKSMRMIFVMKNEIIKHIHPESKIADSEGKFLREAFLNGIKLENGLEIKGLIPELASSPVKKNIYAAMKKEFMADFEKNPITAHQNLSVKINFFKELGMEKGDSESSLFSEQDISAIQEAVKKHLRDKTLGDETAAKLIGVVELLQKKGLPQGTTDRIALEFKRESILVPIRALQEQLAKEKEKLAEVENELQIEGDIKKRSQLLDNRFDERTRTIHCVKQEINKFEEEVLTHLEAYNNAKKNMEPSHVNATLEDIESLDTLQVRKDIKMADFQNSKENANVLEKEVLESLEKLFLNMKFLKESKDSLLKLEEGRKLAFEEKQLLQSSVVELAPIERRIDSQKEIIERLEAELEEKRKVLVQLTKPAAPSKEDNSALQLIGAGAAFAGTFFRESYIAGTGLLAAALNPYTE